MKNKYLHIFYLLSLIFYLTNCPDPSSNNDLVTISGTVTLEGETDHSGVTIALYKPVELDTALVRINQQYPNIGVQISQETEFDHREHTPIYTTLSKADGSWEIKEVEKNTYNIIISKDGFLDRNFYNEIIVIDISINTDLKKLSDLKALNIIETNQLYEIKENISLSIDLTTSCSDVTINLLNNSKIILNLSDNVIIENMCIAGIEGSDCVINGGKNNEIKNLIAYNLDNTNLKDFNSANINSCKFINIRELILENLATTQIRKSYFKKIKYLSFSKLVQNDFNNSICIGEKDKEVLELVETDINISNLVLYKLNKALYFRDYNTVELKNCLIQNNTEGININNNFTGNFKHVKFLQNEYDLKFFYAYGLPNVTLNNNSFRKTLSYTIHLGNLKKNINASNNYWDTTVKSEIKSKIYDQEDNSSIGSVNIDPYLYAQPDSTGIF